MDVLLQFRGDMGTFVRIYSFLSQIFDYGSTEIEKRYLFYKRLIPLLQFGRERDGVDLSGVRLTHHNLKDEGKRTEHAIELPDAGDNSQSESTRVLHRVTPLAQLPLALHPKGPFMTAAVVDVETTGLVADLDEVIEIAAVLLRIDAFGRIVQVLGSAQSLRNPGMPIPAEITRITGISDEMVADIQFDPAPFATLLAKADVIIAHNAQFDARFVERLLPEIAGQPWACSLRQFDWRGAGYDGAALGYLLMQSGLFNLGHRALDDVNSLIHILAQEPDGVGTIMADVIKTASEDTIKVEATGAAFAMRGVLKAQNYHWDAEKKVWWKEVSRLLAAAEQAWLREQVLSARYEPQSYRVSWRERFR